MLVSIRFVRFFFFFLQRQLTEQEQVKCRLTSIDSLSTTTSHNIFSSESLYVIMAKCGPEDTEAIQTHLLDVYVCLTACLPVCLSGGTEYNVVTRSLLIRMGVVAGVVPLVPSCIILYIYVYHYSALLYTSVLKWLSIYSINYFYSKNIFCSAVHKPWYTVVQCENDDEMSKLKEQCKRKWHYLSHLLNVYLKQKVKKLDFCLKSEICLISYTHKITRILLMACLFQMTELDRPDLSLFLVKYLMTLVVGISAVFWVSSKKTCSEWAYFFNRTRKREWDHISSPVTFSNSVSVRSQYVVSLYSVLWPTVPSVRVAGCCRSPVSSSSSTTAACSTRRSTTNRAPTSSRSSPSPWARAQALHHQTPPPPQP